MMPLLLFAAEDPGGWTKAKWGMSSAEIIKLFEGDAIKEDLPAGSTFGRISIPAYEVVGTKFYVLLITDKDDRLDHVSMRPVAMADCTDQLFQSLEELLVQKYGRPWKSDESGTTEFQWTFATTVITLSRTKSSITGAALLSVSYKRRAPGFDKM
jgi:hypothetical protein